MKDAIRLDDEALETLVAEATDDYLERCHRGEQPSLEEFGRRYPAISGILKDLLPAVRLMDPSASGPPPALPQEMAVPGIQGQLGEFRLLREVGRGGMGVVYEAEQISLGRRVALKVLPLAAALDQRQLQRFRLEAQAAAHLHHSHIVSIYSVGQERGQYYYAMQFIDGRSLAEVIFQLQQEQDGQEPGSAGLALPEQAAATKNNNPAAADTTPGPKGVATIPSFRVSGYFPALVNVGIQAAEALEYAHTMGVIHRDIKPANLLLDVQGQLFITDFGLARLHGDAGVTMTGDLVGTLRYMSPEQALGQRSVVDHRSDIYSLGATLYELLTLKPPFDASDRHVLLRQIIEEEPPPPRQHNASVPVDLETIVLKAMAKEPEKRYTSSKEMADDLRRFLEHRPILARRPTLLEKAAKWSRRHRGMVAAGIALLLISALGFAASTALVVREQWKTKAAYQRLEMEQNKTTAAYEAEAAQHVRAETSLRQARDIVDFFIELTEEELADKPELKGLRQKLLAAALDYYKTFIEQRRDDPSLQAQLAASQLKIAAILDEIGSRADALAALERARQLQERLPRSATTSRELQRGFHFAFNRFGMMSGGRDLNLLTQKAVQEDLQLTAEQAKTVAVLYEKRREIFRDGPNFSAEEWKARFDELATQEKTLATLLQPEQAQRLRQLALQQRGTQAFTDPEMAKKLDLAEKQIEKIRGIQDETQRAVWANRPPEPRPEEKKAEELWKSAQQQVLDVLSDEQKSRWQELVGEPFKGKFRSHFRPGPGPRPGPPGTQKPAPPTDMK